MPGARAPGGRPARAGPRGALSPPAADASAAESSQKPPGKWWTRARAAARAGRGAHRVCGPRRAEATGGPWCDGCLQGVLRPLGSAQRGAVEGAHDAGAVVRRAGLPRTPASPFSLSQRAKLSRRRAVSPFRWRRCFSTCGLARRTTSTRTRWTSSRSWTSPWRAAAAPSLKRPHTHIRSEYNRTQPPVPAEISRPRPPPHPPPGRGGARGPVPVPAAHPAALRQLPPGAGGAPLPSGPPPAGAAAARRAELLRRAGRLERGVGKVFLPPRLHSA